MQKLLILAGVLIVVLGLLWPWLERGGLGRIGLGRLPGDFSLRIGEMRVYIPLASSLVVSLILTLLLRLFFRR